MKTNMSFVTGCLMWCVLLASCRGAADLSADGARDREQIANLIGKQGKSSLSEISGTLPADGQTAVPPDGSATSRRCKHRKTQHQHLRRCPRNLDIHCYATSTPPAVPSSP